MAAAAASAPLHATAAVARVRRSHEQVRRGAGEPGKLLQLLRGPRHSLHRLLLSFSQ